jgi:hypothetical protein
MPGQPTTHPVRRCSALMAAALALVASAFVTPLAPAVAGPNHTEGRGEGGVSDRGLTFDESDYTTLTVMIDGKPTKVRWYREVCYVAKPVLMATVQPMGGAIANPGCGYQSMNIYVPERAVRDRSTAIYFAVNNSGWFASYVRASVKEGQSLDSSGSNVGAALKAGYVYADIGTRSRGVVAADGTAGGKAPAVVVDAKAAVRYLRLNDRRMSGSAERIVVNGTSGGGALASILGASGNNRDYLPYLRDIGAAGITRHGASTIRDDVYAVNAYCPITDLGNADIAYEWLYSVLGTRAAVGEDKWPTTTAELAARFPEYQRSLRLRASDGSRLTAGTMLGAIRDEVIRSAEAFMAANPANVIEGYDWIVTDNDADTVDSVDLDRFLTYVATRTQLKPAPAFDQSGVTAPGSGGGPGAGESSLFGTAEQSYSNFTEFGWDHNAIAGDGSGLDDTGLAWRQYLRERSTVVDDQLDLINALVHLGSRDDTAPYWYVRNGALDRDTAFTVSINLSRALEADRDVRDVNYRLAWNTGHAGNYDVPEAMQWIAEVLKEGRTRH